MDEYKGYGYITALKKVPGHVQAELFYYAPGGGSARAPAAPTSRRPRRRLIGRLLPR